MNKINLTYNQGKAVLWNNKEIRIKKNGVIYYVYQNYNGKLEAKDLGGNIYTNLIITTDFDI